MFFYHKYKPRTLDDNQFHPKIAKQLIHLTQDDDLPNLLFYGLPGCGKKTLIDNLLYQIHGQKALSKKTREIKIKPKDSTTFNIKIVESLYHIEIDPTQKSKKDRQIIQYLIKDYASIRHFSSYEGKTRYRLIIILNADKLSYNAQTALRVTMEKYTKSCTIILCSSQLSKIIEPIRSRCFLVRLPKPSKIKLKNIITQILKKENMDENKNLDIILDKYSCNLQKCFPVIQCNNLNLYETWYTLLHKNIINVIIENKNVNVQTIINIRETLYKILSHNISGHLVIRIILNNIHTYIMDDVFLLKITSDIDFRLSNSTKALVHLEYFISLIFLHKSRNNS